MYRNPIDERGKTEEVALMNVKALISGYAFEIGVKSLWALDYPSCTVPHNTRLTSTLRRLERGKRWFAQPIRHDQGWLFALAKTLRQQQILNGD